MKPKLKQCKAKGCKNKFEQLNSFHSACGPKCAIEVTRAKKDKKNREARAALRKARQAALTVPELTKKAQTAFNAYIRARDYGKPCISTGKILNWNKYGGAVDAGHFRSRGSASHLRFNCWNVHAQCANDNQFPSSATSEYRPRLIERIGIERVERLECDNKPRSFSREYLIRLAKIFRKRARLTRKRRGP